MNKHQRTQIEKLLDDLPKTERVRLFKQAAARRLEAQRARKKHEDPDDPPRARTKDDTVRDWAIKILAERAQQNDGARPDPNPDSQAVHRGLVVSVGRRSCLIDDDGRLESCLLSPDIAARQHELLAVGDEAIYEPAPPPGRSRLVRVLPRRTTLSRPDPRQPSRTRVIVANIDAVVIVVSVVAPALHPRLIDRYLVAVQRGGAEPIICVNKIDQLPPGDRSELEQLEPYRRIGIRVIEASAETGAGIEDLRAAIAGKTCAFVGHSGVGKSSLANALDPSLGVKVGTISEAHRRGQHTTTASSLHVIEGGAKVIDTPGVRSFSLDNLSPEQIREAFTEFSPFVDDCRYNDCTHLHEPKCAVRAAAELGQIPIERYETYRRILTEAATDTATERIRPLPESGDD